MDIWEKFHQRYQGFEGFNALGLSFVLFFGLIAFFNRSFSSCWSFRFDRILFISFSYTIFILLSSLFFSYKVLLFPFSLSKSLIFCKRISFYSLSFSYFESCFGLSFPKFCIKSAYLDKEMFSYFRLSISFLWSLIILSYSSFYPFKSLLPWPE